LDSTLDAEEILKKVRAPQPGQAPAIPPKKPQAVTPPPNAFRFNFLKFSKLLFGKNTDSARRAQLLEVAAIVVSIAVMFGTIALTLHFLLNETAEKDSKRQHIQAPIKHNEIQLGHTAYMIGHNGGSASHSDSSNKVRIVEFQTTVLVQKAGLNLLKTEDFLKKYRHRSRSIMQLIVREATDEEISEPSLRQIRNKAKIELNKMLKKDLVQEVVFSEFRTFHMNRTSSSFTDPE